MLAFGALQTYYEQDLLPAESSSRLAWISTTCAFILLFSGLVTGPLFDHGYLRPLLLTGSILEVFGLMMLSISTEYWQVFLSQGICVGLGGGLLFIPSVAAAALSLQDFRRAKFIGVISSATGVGRSKPDKYSSVLDKPMTVISRWRYLPHHLPPPCIRSGLPLGGSNNRIHSLGHIFIFMAYTNVSGKKEPDGTKLSGHLRFQ